MFFNQTKNLLKNDNFLFEEDENIPAYNHTKYEEYRQAIKEKYQIDIDDFKVIIEGSPIKDFNIQEIVKFPIKEIIDGIKVETEHTSNYMIALEIAIAHLLECEKYYTYLEAMEAKFEKNDKLRDKYIVG